MQEAYQKINANDDQHRTLVAQQSLNTLIAAAPNMNDLIQFHRNHKFFLQSKDERLYRELGYIVGNHENKSLHEIIAQYQSCFHIIIKKKTTLKQSVNAVQHMAGFLKNDLTKAEKTQLHQHIEEVAQQRDAMSAILRTLKRYARKYNNTYLLNQTLLNLCYQEVKQHKR
ncbi:YbgA family protein [Sulfurospirillum sp. 1612]|uniref:YbgA family protein n=1 Tax=Sulfurospirillum sp. 1612 TaxID=3094835 RepID=UPI002F955C36